MSVCYKDSIHDTDNLEDVAKFESRLLNDLEDYIKEKENKKWKLKI